MIRTTTPGNAGFSLKNGLPSPPCHIPRSHRLSLTSHPLLTIITPHLPPPTLRSPLLLILISFAMRTPLVLLAPLMRAIRRASSLHAHPHGALQPLYLPPMNTNNYYSGTSVLFDAAGTFGSTAKGVYHIATRGCHWSVCAWTRNLDTCCLSDQIEAAGVVVRITIAPILTTGAIVISTSTPAASI